MFAILCNPVISSGLSEDNKSEFNDIKKEDIIEHFKNKAFLRRL